MKPEARLLDWAVAGVEPAFMGAGPVIMAAAGLRRLKQGEPAAGKELAEVSIEADEVSLPLPPALLAIA